MSAAAAAFAAALSSAVLAWPVNARLELAVGEEKFQKLTPDAWLEVEDPRVAEAELFETWEVMLTGKAPGSTLVLVHAEDKVMVWRVTVRAAGAAVQAAAAPPPEDPLAAARKACGEGMKVEGESLTATIRDERCRQALHALLQQDRFLARDLDLTFEVAPLQAQLRAVQQGISRTGAPVEAAYLGAGLLLKGRATAAQHRRILWEVFRASVGRIALEDRIEIEGAEGAKLP
jgi:hypothetical protein